MILNDQIITEWKLQSTDEGLRLYNKIIYKKIHFFKIFYKIFFLILIFNYNIWTRAMSQYNILTILEDKIKTKVEKTI